MDNLSQIGDGVVDKSIDFGYNKSSQLTAIQRYSDLSGTTEVAETSYDYDYDKAERLTDIRHQHGGRPLRITSWSMTG